MNVGKIYKYTTYDSGNKKIVDVTGDPDTKYTSYVGWYTNGWIYTLTDDNPQFTSSNSDCELVLYINGGEYRINTTYTRSIIWDKETSTVTWSLTLNVDDGFFSPNYVFGIEDEDVKFGGTKSAAFVIPVQNNKYTRISNVEMMQYLQ